MIACCIFIVFALFWYFSHSVVLAFDVCYRGNCTFCSLTVDGISGDYFTAVYPNRGRALQIYHLLSVAHRTHSLFISQEVVH